LGVGGWGCVLGCVLAVLAKARGRESQISRATGGAGLNNL